MSYMKQTLHALRALDPAPEQDSDGLRWHSFDDYGAPGWAINVGFSVEFEAGDAPSIWIHKAELNTGQRVIQLGLNDIPTNELEAELSELVDLECRIAAEDLALSREDEGDFLLDAKRDRQ